jgi:hypothetical protein
MVIVWVAVVAALLLFKVFIAPGSGAPAPTATPTPVAPTAIPLATPVASTVTPLPTPDLRTNTPAATAIPTPVLPEVAPDFSLKGAKGVEFTLSEQLAQGPVVVVFFSQGGG